MLVREQDVPARQQFIDAFNQYEWEGKYKAALEAAKKKAIRCVDSDLRGELFANLDNGQPIELPEGYTYEVKGVCEACNRVGMRNCAHFDECGANELIALIKPRCCPSRRRRG